MREDLVVMRFRCPNQNINPQALKLGPSILKLNYVKRDIFMKVLKGLYLKYKGAILKIFG